MHPEIVLVEDDGAVQEALADALQLQGYHVACAENGKAGLALIRARGQPPPALVITDLQMPVMDGWALLRALHDDPSLRPVRTIVITGSPVRPEEVDADCVLTKPVNLAQLLQQVAHTAAGQI